MTKSIRRVAVIGAGPAGAIATDALVKEQAFDEISVFERQESPGGTWCVRSKSVVERVNINSCRVLSSNEDGGIPSLRDLLHQNVNQAVSVPSRFPCETALSNEVNSQKLRFSDTGAHANLHSNLPTEIMCFTQEPIPKVLSGHSLAQYGPGSPFRPREVMQTWVDSIFVRGEHVGLVQFGTTVELAEHKN